MKKITEKNFDRISGGVIREAIFTGGDTSIDPREYHEDFDFAGLGGYAVYDDNGRYLAGFATGYANADLRAAQIFVEIYNTFYPDNQISDEVISF